MATITTPESPQIDDDNHHIIPDDVIIDHILTRIPLKSQIRFSCVCRLWSNSINRLWFNSIHDHFLKQSQSILPRKVRNESFYQQSLLKRRKPLKRELVGYYNGLACYLCTFYQLINFQRINIYDPSHNYGLYLPHIPQKYYGIITSYGFGFDSVTNQHKVVCFPDGEELKCLVYTLKTEDTSSSSAGSTAEEEQTTLLKRTNVSWREMDITSPFPCRLLKSAAIVWKEALCWRTENPQVIILFHLHEEKFQVIIQSPTLETLICTAKRRECSTSGFEPRHTKPKLS